MKSSDKVKTQVKHLRVESEDAAYTLVSDAHSFGRKYISTDGNGNCLYEAVLMQVFHLEDFTIALFRKEVGFFVVENWRFFFPILKAQLPEGQSFESYARNIYLGFAHGDLLVLQVIAKMWRLKITVIDPYVAPIKVWHDASPEKTDIVLLYNGNDHYSGTYQMPSYGSAVKISPADLTITFRDVERNTL